MKPIRGNNEIKVALYYRVAVDREKETVDTNSKKEELLIKYREERMRRMCSK